MVAPGPPESRSEDGLPAGASQCHLARVREPPESRITHLPADLPPGLARGLNPPGVAEAGSQEHHPDPGGWVGVDGARRDARRGPDEFACHVDVSAAGRQSGHRGARREARRAHGQDDGPRRADDQGLHRTLELYGVLGTTGTMSESTQIRIEGKPGSLEGIQQGAPVKASYVVTDGVNVGKIVEVTPAPPSSPRAPGSASVVYEFLVSAGWRPARGRAGRLRDRAGGRELTEFPGGAPRFRAGSAPGPGARDRAPCPRRWRGAARTPCRSRSRSPA